MSAQHKFRPQIMSAKDRQFDNLLRRAAQHFQQVTVDMQTQRNTSRERQHDSQKNLRFAAYAAKG
jgi:hypothetical protein